MWVRREPHISLLHRRDTRQIDGVTGDAPDPALWYYEPTDYEGDVLWSRGFVTRAAAEDAARIELEGGAL
jgi:hypothetical protein